ncbi:MAG: DNA repair protein RecN [Clostridiales bacterium]|nr:DNA repair protein RecN [Clostridiales bacterium]
MLIKISISGFALIDSLDFEPGDGLNVISGETGAGKSLLIDAIGALIGNRIGKENVRTGSDKATVEGVFDKVSSVIHSTELSEMGIQADEDDLLYVSREIQIAGRNIVRINGTLVPLFVLKSIGPRILDIHGQYDQQTIFQVTKHVELLDRYAGDKMERATNEYSVVLARYKDCLDDIKRLGTDPLARERRAELLRYQIEELEEADFKPGEDEVLFEKKKIVNGIEKAKASVESLDQIFSSDDHLSAFSKMHEAEEHIRKLAEMRDGYRAVALRMKSLLLELDSLEEDLGKLNRDLEDADYSLQDIEDRIDLLFRFRSKYGATADDMCLYLEKAKQELDELLSSEDQLKELHSQRVVIEKELMNKAMNIRSIRKAAGINLSNEIVHELNELGMPGSKFSVSLSERPKSRFFSKNGCDEVAFMFTANPGEPEKPLERIASGGEASRIMLAIKTILANADSTQSLIFDEIDSGVSGRTSTAVASKMKRLARYKQVLCVTHMAQLAAAADHNFFISKKHDMNRTQTVLVQLDDEGKRNEVARLLSGEADIQSLNLSEHMISKQNKD